MFIEPLYQCNIYWTCLSNLYASAISIDLLIGVYTVAIYVLLMQYSLDVLTALYNAAISHWTIVRRFPAVPNSENFNMDQLHNPDDEYYSPCRVPVELYRTRNIFNGSSACQSVQFFTSNSLLLLDTCRMKNEIWKEPILIMSIGYPRHPITTIS